MKVKWLGHACFLITSDTGTRILTDPYEPGFRGIIDYARIDETADIVTTSHQHGDHNHVTGLPGNPAIVEGEGVHNVAGIEFKGVPCYHDKAAGKERGPNTIFCFTINDICLCHMGDLGHPLSQDQVASLGKVDVLMIPTGGPAATLELKEAVELCQTLKPKMVLAMHFKTDKCSFPKYTAEDLMREARNARKVNSNLIEVTRENLPTSTEILIMDHAL